MGKTQGVLSRLPMSIVKSTYDFLSQLKLYVCMSVSLFI